MTSTVQDPRYLRVAGLISPLFFFLAQMNRIDFDLLVNELRKQMRDHTDPNVNVKFFGASFFHEFRTLGFTAARQTGKTYWIGEQLKKDTSACIIVPKGGPADEIFHYQPRMGQSELNGRIFSIKELRVLLGRDQFEAWSTIYIDDATHMYHFFKKQLLDYLLKHQRFETTIILVG